MHGDDRSDKRQLPVKGQGLSSMNTGRDIGVKGYEVYCGYPEVGKTNHPSQGRMEHRRNVE